MVTIIYSILIRYSFNTFPKPNIHIIMNIQVGDKAPEFNLVTLTEEGPQTVQLADLAAKSNDGPLVRADGIHWCLHGGVLLNHQ